MSSVNTFCRGSHSVSDLNSVIDVNLVSDVNPVMEGFVYTLRNSATQKAEFERILRKIGLFLGYEIAKTLPTKEVSIKSIMGVKANHYLLSEEPVVVGIIRAGLPLMNGIRKVIPSQGGFVAAARDEKNLKASISYEGVPPLEDQTLIVADTMLATGGSMADTIKYLIDKVGRPSRIITASVFAAPKGIARVLKEIPNIDIYTSVIDSHLNDVGYIVPGCGDAGDRINGKKH